MTETPVVVSDADDGRALEDTDVASVGRLGANEDTEDFRCNN